MTLRTLKDLAVEFLSQIVEGDVAGAFNRHVGKGFIHHNPYFHGDAVSLRMAMEEDEKENPGKTLDVRIALEDGNYVTVHSRLRRRDGESEFAVVHIFRFDQKRIVEAWDIVQIVPDRTVNENGMF